MVLAEEVVLKPRLLLAHMYGDDLDTIIGEFGPEDVGYSLPGLRHHLWHTFQRVVTRDAWGWVTVDAFQVRGAEGSK